MFEQICAWLKNQLEFKRISKIESPFSQTNRILVIDTLIFQSFIDKYIDNFATFSKTDSISNQNIVRLPSMSNFCLFCVEKIHQIRNDMKKSDWLTFSWLIGRHNIEQCSKVRWANGQHIAMRFEFSVSFDFQCHVKMFSIAVELLEPSEQ